jgi:hypothetical protein
MSIIQPPTVPRKVTGPPGEQRGGLRQIGVLTGVITASVVLLVGCAFLHTIAKHRAVPIRKTPSTRTIDQPALLWDFTVGGTGA